MDFSKDAFRSNPLVTFSNDTMDHAKMVMACRFGWAAGPGDSSQISPQSVHTTTTSPTSPSAPSYRRFTACHGNLYHQLECGHRIRTDLVDACGLNCLEPLPNPGYYCHECVDNEAAQIWSQREMEHNSMYPPLDSMIKEQYDQWYEEHRQLEAQYAADRKVYEVELRLKTRPSNRCMRLESTKEELDFAAELGSLNLMVGQQEITAPQNSSRPTRMPIPGDTSEQLHWALGQLDLERGHCAVEAASYQPNTPTTRPVTTAKDEEL